MSLLYPKFYRVEKWWKFKIVNPKQDDYQYYVIKKKQMLGTTF